MPAPPPPSDWREQVLPALFWIGVALAPIAALLLLLGQGGSPLRIAAVLTLVCVVLIGLSVALRNDVETVRVEVEATILDEADAIREETREDMVSVARKIHYALREEIAELSGRVDEIRSEAAHHGHRATPNPQPDVAVGRGVVHHAGTARVTAQPTSVSDEPTLNRRAASAGRAEPAAAGQSWSVRTPTARVALESHTGGHAPTPHRSWDPLSDDLAAQPAAPGALDASHRADDPGRTGRRRAAEPDEPVPVAQLESGRRASDPWADLRGNTQPAEVRFGAREPVTTSRYNGGSRGYGTRGYDKERVPVRAEPRRPEPGPLDPGWRGNYQR